MTGSPEAVRGEGLVASGFALTFTELGAEDRERLHTLLRLRGIGKPN